MGVASTPATTALLRICRTRDENISPPPGGARLCDSDFAPVPLRRQFQRRNNWEKKLRRLPFVGRVWFGGNSLPAATGKRVIEGAVLRHRADVNRIRPSCQRSSAHDPRPTLASAAALLACGIACLGRA